MFAGVFATCRCTSCKAGALGAAVVPLQTPRSQREMGLGGQQHRIVGMGETQGFTGAWDVCGRRGTEAGSWYMWLLAPWKFWYAAHTQEVGPP